MFWKSRNTTRNAKIPKVFPTPIEGSNPVINNRIESDFTNPAPVWFEIGFWIDWFWIKLIL